ncbi:hypothetical protein VQ042_20830 [Aurantimonas sp. A2-1-M11]|uniref:hypothetical protein n=1 Tax=Aurantimonas sp. A2-1-M11 TaxID=3113712 RepID=UPI002F93CC27
MTDQQLYMYQQSQMMAQARRQARSNQLSQPMPVIQYPTMATPQVTPLSRPGGNQIRCISASIYTNCRY